MNLVAEPIGERWAERPVDQPVVKDRFLAGATFPAEEAAGDLAGGVHALFDVDGQREEVCVPPWIG